MARFIFRCAVVGAVALTVVGVAAGASYRGISPLLIAGNPGCADVPGLSFSSQTTKFSPALNGSAGNGVYLFVEGNVVGWYTLGDVNVKAVIVKGGPAANAYVYPGGDYSDGSLVSPTNPKNGKLYDLGYVTVCT